MIELGQSADPVALVPGDPAGLFDMAASWRARASAASTAADALRGLAAPEGWEGQAADAYSARQGSAAGAWSELSESLSAAADAVEEFATTLGWAQQKAGDAIAMWESVNASSAVGMAEYRTAVRQAGATDIVPLYVDAGESTRVEARALLAYARS